MAKLSAKQRAYVKKRSKVHVPGPDELDDELNIVPFLDIVINLIMFLLMVTSSVAFYTQVEASLPTYGGGVGGRGSNTPTLNLSVFLTTNGITVTGSTGKLLPGCENVTTGDTVTVPMNNGRYDWNALTECVARVKAFADREGLDYQDDMGQGRITVSADPQVVYQDLLWAMDAVREKDGEQLFPSVLLSAGVR